MEPEPLTSKLLKASVAGCDCDTKTPELAYHDPMCHYRLFMECFKALTEPNEDNEEAEASVTPSSGCVSSTTELCGCMKCCSERLNETHPFLGSSLPGWRYACELCGCKRCPHHTDHRLACTRSNAPGQEGSAWE